ncbi:thiamin pyrophosphokinase 1 isoform X2 [Cylas formicarius]|uniref:thiamin pyrophosphokinase 1 isoform X2 n=1 Tax=Cylas formicarius TaxID=197179 RepID=UPI002958C819|nr:thiamin pyrophosphokinase 1 isoform X2 [Cylas formicarius]
MGNQFNRTFFTESNIFMERLETWRPCEEILGDFRDRTYAVIVLNRRINVCFRHDVVFNMWTQDGGTERWIKWLSDHEYELSDAPVPDLITGDMDSLSEEVLIYFKKTGSRVICTPDQDETDFTKALRQLEKYMTTHDTKLDTIYVFGDTSGRFDQILANINSLYKALTFLANVKIYQIASNSITWLLNKGKHCISIPESLRVNLDWCALIPIGSPCIVSSNGLKWNLNDSKLAFGDMVSSSNTYSGEPVVCITTDSPVVWSMGIGSLS